MVTLFPRQKIVDYKEERSEAVVEEVNDN